MKVLQLGLVRTTSTLRRQVGEGYAERFGRRHVGAANRPARNQPVQIRNRRPVLDAQLFREATEGDESQLAVRREFDRRADSGTPIVSGVATGATAFRFGKSIIGTLASGRIKVWRCGKR